MYCFCIFGSRTSLRYQSKTGKTVVTISVALNKMQKYYLAKIANYYDNLGYFNSTDNVTDPDIQKPK